ASGPHQCTLHRGHRCRTALRPHKHLYFCAREDFSGYHNFASTLSDHMKNARRFQRALTERLRQEGQAK
ncbi:MAG: hypothetical protein PHR05_06975, partial [Bacteroidales bacterium]|nr:hypothetical protein [Bacteroidales bacterium]